MFDLVYLYIYAHSNLKDSFHLGIFFKKKTLNISRFCIYL